MARRLERLDRGIKVRSDTIYALASPSSILYLAAPGGSLVLGLLFLPILLAPWPYWDRVALSACVMALLALSFDFLAHVAGLACLGGALFFGVGGYLAAALDAGAGWPAGLAVPAASVLGAALCAALLYPCLPLRGIYFAVVTLMLPLLATRLIEAGDLFGGTEGLRGLQGFQGPWTERYVLAGALILAVFGLRRFAAETPGLVLKAIRDNEQAVKACGIDTARRKAAAVFLAGLPGCFAGACYAELYRSVGVSAFAMDLSLLPMAATIVGGPGSLAGGVAGAFLLVPLGEVLRDFGSLRVAIYALVLIAAVLLKSEGLLAWAGRRWRQFERTVDV